MHHPSDSEGKKMAAGVPKMGGVIGDANAVDLLNDVDNDSHDVAIDDYPDYHQHPQSLNLLSPPPPPGGIPAGVQQAKKKSGFQITSVTPALISVSSGNNSVAEDTESYDELDETSHTEDNLSSSDLLDASLSLSRHNGGAVERTSSEETLNNFHEADTPGAVSPNPNQPPHALNQVSQHVGSGSGGTPLVNGTAHFHHHHPHPHTPQGQHHVPQAQSHPASSGHGEAAATLPSSGATQKMPSFNSGPAKEININISVGPPAPLNVTASQPAPREGSVPPSSGGTHTEGTTASGANPPTTSDVADVNTMSSPARFVPPKGAVGTGGCVVPPSPISRGDGGGGAVGAGSLATTAIAAAAAASASGVVTQLGGVGSVSSTHSVGGPSSSSAQSVAPPAAHPGGGPSSSAQSVAPPAHPGGGPSSSAQSVAPPAAPVSSAPGSSSRFRVVKLDSTSAEPFKKGRWTCAEFYEKVETSAPNVPASLPSAEASAGGPAPPSPRPPTGGEGRESVGETPQDLTTSSTHPKRRSSSSSAAAGSIHHQPVVSHPHHPPQQQLTYAQAVASPPPDTSHHLAQHHHGLLQQQQQQHRGYTAGSLPQQQQQRPCAAPSSSQILQAPPPQQISSLPGTAGVPQPGAPPPMVDQQQSLQALKIQSGPSLHHHPQAPSSTQQQQQPSVLQAPQKAPHRAPTTQSTGLSVVAQSWQDFQDLASSQSAALHLAHHAGQTTTPMPSTQPALYANLPGFSATQLEDARGFLLGLPGAVGQWGHSSSSGGGGGASEGNVGVSVGALTTSTSGLLDDSSSGASVVAIDNKIEQAMDLVKSHLMYAVREEVEVLKEQIKELMERNSQLEQENNLLKTLASPEQMAQFQSQVMQSGAVVIPQPGPLLLPPQQQQHQGGGGGLLLQTVVAAAAAQPAVASHSSGASA